MVTEMTLAYAKEQLGVWLDAMEKVSGGQEYTIGGIRNGRQLRRADLPEIRSTVEWWEKKVAQLEAGATGGIRIRRAIP